MIAKSAHALISFDKHNSVLCTLLAMNSLLLTPSDFGLGSSSWDLLAEC